MDDLRIGLQGDEHVEFSLTASRRVNHGAGDTVASAKSNLAATCRNANQQEQACARRPQAASPNGTMSPACARVSDQPVGISKVMVILPWAGPFPLAATALRINSPEPVIPAYLPVPSLTTALVNEADARLVGSGEPPRWEGCGHFFAAAAEAMRRILIDRARRKQTRKAGGGRRRLDLDDIEPTLKEENSDRLLTLDEALRQLKAEDPR
jgi:hypothetical protein